MKQKLTNTNKPIPNKCVKKYRNRKKRNGKLTIYNENNTFT